MSIKVAPAMTLLKQALNHRATRQDLISSNIANVTTPGYRPRDISFEEMLAEKKSEMYPDKKKAQLALAQTDVKHLEPKSETSTKEAKLFFRDGHMAKNDGNSVDLDVETTELAKNAQMYNAVIAAMKKGGRTYMSVIEASAKTS